MGWVSKQGWKCRALPAPHKYQQEQHCCQFGPLGARSTKEERERNSAGALGSTPQSHTHMPRSIAQPNTCRLAHLVVTRVERRVAPILSHPAIHKKGHRSLPAGRNCKHLPQSSNSCHKIQQPAAKPAAHCACVNPVHILPGNNELKTEGASALGRLACCNPKSSTKTVLPLWLAPPAPRVDIAAS